MSSILKRVFIDSTKIKVFGLRHLSHGQQMDTLSVAKMLESKGLPLNEAEAIATTLVDVSRNVLEVASSSLVSIPEAEKDFKLQEATFETFKTEINGLQNRNLLKLENELSKDAVNFERTHRELVNKTNLDINELKAHLEAVKFELKAEVEKAKFEVNKYCMATIILSISALSLTVLRLWS